MNSDIAARCTRARGRRPVCLILPNSESHQKAQSLWAALPCANFSNRAAMPLASEGGGRGVNMGCRRGGRGGWEMGWLSTESTNWSKETQPGARGEEEVEEEKELGHFSHQQYTPNPYHTYGETTRYVDKPELAEKKSHRSQETSLCCT